MLCAPTEMDLGCDDVERKHPGGSEPTAQTPRGRAPTWKCHVAPMLLKNTLQTHTFTHPSQTKSHLVSSRIRLSSKRQKFPRYTKAVSLPVCEVEHPGTSPLPLQAGTSTRETCPTTRKPRPRVGWWLLTTHIPRTFWLSSLKNMSTSANSQSRDFGALFPCVAVQRWMIALLRKRRKSLFHLSPPCGPHTGAGGQDI